MKLSGRHILITGAASGIGRATAELFAREGAALALTDRNKPALETFAEQMRAAADVASSVVDMADGAAIGEAVDRLAADLGGLDGVVCSAGIDMQRPFGDLTNEEWETTMAVNLGGPFRVCRAAVPHLRAAGGGTLVQIASGAALRPIENRTAYCASKAGQVMLAKSMAVDLAPYAIRSNAICPGAVDTPLFRSSWEDSADPQAALDAIRKRYLIEDIGQPEDIANAALFLTCADSKHITGAALAVDGGRTFH